MRLSISNIAWDVPEDEAVSALLRRYGADAIDVAPSKYFPVFAEVTDADLARVRQWWTDRGVAIIGMQSLLFGTAGLNLFGDAPVQEAMLGHLDHVCRIGAGLGASRLVFGSPRNRDRGTLDAAATDAIAVPFFRRLGAIADGHGVVVCLEPNPPCYGANFLTTSAETARMVRLVDHPAIRMQLDTGAIAFNGEDTAQVVRDCAPLIGHIHASEPNLVPLGDGGADHGAVAAALSEVLPTLPVTIEMVATRNEPHLAAIERALDVALRTYGAVKGGGR